MSRSIYSPLECVGLVYTVICRYLSAQEKFARLTHLSNCMTKQLNRDCFKDNCMHVRTMNGHFPHSLLHHILVASCIEYDGLSSMCRVEQEYLDKLKSAFESNSLLKQVVIREDHLDKLDSPILMRFGEVLHDCRVIPYVQSLGIVLEGLFQGDKLTNAERQLSMFDWSSLTKFDSLQELHFKIHHLNIVRLPIRAILSHLPTSVYSLTLSAQWNQSDEGDLGITDITAFFRLYTLDKLSLETGKDLLQMWNQSATPDSWPAIHALSCFEENISLIFELQALTDLSLHCSLDSLATLNPIEIEFTEILLPHLERFRIEINSKFISAPIPCDEQLELLIQVISRSTKLREIVVYSRNFCELTDETIGYIAACKQLQLLSLHLLLVQKFPPSFHLVTPSTIPRLFHSQTLDRICPAGLASFDSSRARD